MKLVANFFGEKVLLPRMYLVKLSIFCVVGYLEFQFKKGNGSPVFHDLAHSFLFPFAKGNNDTPFLSTYNQFHDQRLMEIRSIYSGCSIRSKCKDSPLKLYYVDLLERNSDTKDLTSEYYKKYGDENDDFHKLIIEKKLAALYYFLEDILYKDPENKKYKEAIYMFKLQDMIERLYSDYTMKLSGSFRSKYEKKY